MRTTLILIAIFLTTLTSALSVDYNEGTSCETFMEQVGQQIQGKSIPSAAPFTNEIFTIFIDERRMGTITLEEKMITETQCNTEAKTTYKIHVKSSALKEINEETTPFSFYNKKKMSGEIKIEGVGFGKKLKLSLINFGAKIAGWIIKN